MIKYNACPQWATVSGRKVLESPGERRLCTVRVWCTQVRGKTWETPNALDSKEIKQSILKEINLEYSLEGLMPKCQYFGHLMQRANSLEKTLMLEKLEVRRRRGRHWLNGHESEQTLGDGDGEGCWRAAVHGVAKSCTDWTTTKVIQESTLLSPAVPPTPCLPDSSEVLAQDTSLSVLVVRKPINSSDFATTTYRDLEHIRLPSQASISSSVKMREQ